MQPQCHALPVFARQPHAKPAITNTTMAARQIRTAIAAVMVQSAQKPMQPQCHALQVFARQPHVNLAITNTTMGVKQTARTIADLMDMCVKKVVIQRLANVPDVWGLPSRYPGTM